MTLQASATIPDGYYTKLDGKKKEALKTAAYETINPHTVLKYGDLFPEYFPYTDVYPELYNGQKRWWEMYSNEVFYVRDGYSGMNREHSFPKSWWGGSQTAPYTDLNHLYPSESDANTAKSNYPLGVVKNAKFDNGVSRVGTPEAGQGGNAGQVFEPADQYKGDFARTYFYMVTCYQNMSWKYTYMAKDGAYPSLQPWALELLLDWARRDPVSQKEKDRNEAVYRFQGNRNPFIDFPELAEYIWGTRTAETFYVKDQGGSVTPPITGDPELTAPASGTSVDFGQTAVGHTSSTDVLINGINLRSALSVRVTGADRAYFTLSGVTDNQIPASLICSPEGYKLRVNYTPPTTGSHTATLSLYDGGLAADKQVTVTLRGEALPVPTLTAPVAIDATDLTDESYTARWQAPPAGEVIDYYILTRTRQGASGGTTKIQVPAPSTSYTVTGRDPNVAETYSLCSVRLGIHSPESNTVAVATGNVVGIEADLTPRVYSDRGMLTIDLDMEVPVLCVYDLSGRLVRRMERASGTFSVELPRGVYIVATGSLSPAKAIVY